MSGSRVRIHSHVTQSRFLHVEDCLNIAKLRLFAGSYRRGQGSRQHCHHFVDLADARVICAALARGAADFNYKEYKGTPGRDGAAAISRVLQVQIKAEQAFIQLSSGPGRVTATGAVTPAGRGAVEINISLRRHEAQCLGAAVQAYLAAWDVWRLLHQQARLAPPARFEWAPAVSSAAEN